MVPPGGSTPLSEERNCIKRRIPTPELRGGRKTHSTLRLEESENIKSRARPRGSAARRGWGPGCGCALRTLCRRRGSRRRPHRKRPGRPAGAERGPRVARLAGLGGAHHRRRRGRGAQAGPGRRGGAARLSPPRTALGPAAVRGEARRPGGRAPLGTTGGQTPAFACVAASARAAGPWGVRARSAAGGAQGGAKARRGR
ncbi:uncharacterized protein [Odocoileus virginianus]|uniref:Uncharacterized protein n=1 Tax=Odocoileus virginianus TaxID=9874 RepID=A0ABM4J0N7_ODOVR